MPDEDPIERYEYLERAMEELEEQASGHMLAQAIQVVVDADMHYFSGPNDRVEELRQIILEDLKTLHPWYREGGKKDAKKNG